MPNYMGKAPYKSNPYEGELVGDNPTITIGAEDTNVIKVTVQLKTGPNNLDVPGFVDAYLSDNADGSTLAASAPSGGWAIHASGLLLPLITNKYATFRSSDAGVFDIDITEASTKTFYLVLIIPGVGQVVSNAITFA